MTDETIRENINDCKQHIRSPFQIIMQNFLFLATFIVAVLLSQISLLSFVHYRMLDRNIDIPLIQTVEPTLNFIIMCVDYQFQKDSLLHTYVFKIQSFYSTHFIHVYLMFISKNNYDNFHNLYKSFIYQIN